MKNHIFPILGWVGFASPAGAPAPGAKTPPFLPPEDGISLGKTPPSPPPPALQSPPSVGDLRQELIDSLLQYHRLDGMSDGSRLSGTQYPPMVQDGDETGLKQLIDHLSDFLAGESGIDYMPSPQNPDDRKAFRQRIAREALPEMDARLMDAFNATVESLQDSGIKAFVKEALGKAQPEFWIAPSSSSGKYHPADEINQGGLLLHTIRDVVVGRMLCQFFNLPADKVDEISAALILHDIQKGGIPWKKNEKAGDAPYSGYDPAHGPVAEEWLSKLPRQDPPVSVSIENEVGNHMAQWNVPKPTPPKTLADQIVSWADYLASRSDVYVSWRSHDFF